MITENQIIRDRKTNDLLKVVEIDNNANIAAIQNTSTNDVYKISLKELNSDKFSIMSAINETVDMRNQNNDFKYFKPQSQDIINVEDFFKPNVNMYTNLVNKLDNSPTSNQPVYRDDDDIYADSDSEMEGIFVNNSGNADDILEKQKNEVLNKYKKQFFEKKSANQSILTQEPSYEEDYVVEDIEPNIQRNETQQSIQQSSMIEEKPTDHFSEILKDIERNVNIHIPINIDEKIPNIDFIKMWEMTYKKKSIIEYLTDDIYNNIMNNPSKLKESIKDTIEVLVYGKKEQLKKEEIVEKVVKKKKTTKKKDEQN